MDYMVKKHESTPNPSFRRLDALLPVGARYRVLLIIVCVDNDHRVVGSNHVVFWTSTIALCTC